MANPFIGVRIPPELEQALIARIQETGQSKSDIVISALKSYLGMKSCYERLDEVEQRLSILEEIAQESGVLARRQQKQVIHVLDHAPEHHRD